MKKINFEKWNEKQLNSLYFICFLLLIGLICFLSFYKLDLKYVDPWDEARHGVNAYEMFKEGNLVKSTYLYETDYYNLKPPLSMWCIMISFAVFGTNVFALRFYSAFCYVLLAVAVGLFVRKNYGRLESLFAIGFLAANTTPFVAHMVRAGDADSLYVLLFTLAMLSMLQIRNNPNYLYACGLFFALAFLTKSFHAGVIVAIGGLFLLITGELKKMSLKKWGLFIGSFAVPIGIWAIPRFFTDGIHFFRQMLYTDVLGRSSEGFGSVEGSFTYYMEYYLGLAGSNFPNMASKGTVYAFALIICMIGAIYYNKLFAKANYKKIIGYVLWFFIPLLAFSVVRTKLLWYMYPVFIPLFMAAGILAGRLIKEKNIVSSMRVVMALVIICGIAYFSKDVYVQITDKIQNQQSAIEFQLLVKETAGDTVASTNAYVLHDKENATWNQQDVFIAEAYGDLYCVNVEGGEGVFVDNLMKNLITFNETIVGKQNIESADGNNCICYLYKDGSGKIIQKLTEMEAGVDISVKRLAESENYVAVLLEIIS